MEAMTKETSSRAIREDDEIDLRELLGVLIDRKWWIVGTTLLFAFVGAAYALLSAPVYQAQTLVQVESKMPTIPGLADLTSLGGGGSTAATTEVALLTSRTIVGTAVDRMQLDVLVDSHCWVDFLLAGLRAERQMMLRLRCWAFLASAGAVRACSSTILRCPRSFSTNP